MGLTGYIFSDDRRKRLEYRWIVSVQIIYRKTIVFKRVFISNTDTCRTTFVYTDAPVW